MANLSGALHKKLNLYPSHQDSVFLDAIRCRDKPALKALFEALNPALVKMLSCHGIFGEKAEDLIHETWETFFQNLHKFEGRSQLKTFALGILINKIREFRRSSARTDLEDDSEKIFNRSFTPEGWWAQEPADPHKLMESKEIGQQIQECMEGLTEAQKSAFILIEVNKEEASAASNLLGISVSHLRVLIFRAKDKLRSCLTGKLAY